jgi:hypothetical protein
MRSELDAVFADGSEHRPNVGEFEQFANTLADVDKFESAA